MKNPSLFMYCLDCGRVGEIERLTGRLRGLRVGCPRCASRALYPVKSWIDRIPEKEDGLETGIQRERREAAERARDEGRSPVIEFRKAAR